MKKIGNLFTGIIKFFKGIITELKKVTWPGRKQIINNTSIVIICILVIGAAIWILDAIFGFGLAKFVGDVADTVPGTVPQ